MATTLMPFGTRSPDLFDEFRREMDSLMNRFWEGDGPEATWFAPLANIAETDKNYEVSLDLPGLKPEEFNIELKHGDLWITGERKREHEEKGKTFHRIERQYGEFRRVIHLGDDVDPENVEAQYKDGVLKITVGKTETARPKKIEVKS